MIAVDQMTEREDQTKEKRQGFETQTFPDEATLPRHDVATLVTSETLNSRA